MRRRHIGLGTFHLKFLPIRAPKRAGGRAQRHGQQLYGAMVLVLQITHIHSLVLSSKINTRITPHRRRMGPRRHTLFGGEKKNIQLVAQKVTAAIEGALEPTTILD